MYYGENGILRGAEYAVDKYKNKSEQEENYIGILSNEIDSYIAGKRDVSLSSEIKNYIDSKSNWKYLGSVQNGTEYIPNSTYTELVKEGYNEVMMVGKGGIRTYSMNLPIHILSELGTRTYLTGASTHSRGLAGVMEIKYDEQNGFCLSRFFLDDELLSIATMYFYAR